MPQHTTALTSLILAQTLELTPPLHLQLDKRTLTMPLMRRQFEPAQPMHYPHPAPSMPLPEVVGWPELPALFAPFGEQPHKSAATETGSSHAMKCPLPQLEEIAEVMLDCPLAEMELSARELMECAPVKVEQIIEEVIQRSDEGNEIGQSSGNVSPLSINRVLLRCLKKQDLLSPSSCATTKANHLPLRGMEYFQVRGVPLLELIPWQTPSSPKSTASLASQPGISKAAAVGRHNPHSAFAEAPPALSH